MPPSLGGRFDGLEQVGGHQHALLAEQLIQAEEERVPLVLRQFKMAAEIEQGHLSDAAALAPGFDQVNAEVGFAACSAGDQTTDVLSATIAEVKAFGPSNTKSMALHNDFADHPKQP